MAIVKTAHERNKPVTVHVTSAKDLGRALDAGVDEIAHMVVDELSDELVFRMVETGTRWVPTLELWQLVSRAYVLEYGKIAVKNLDDRKVRVIAKAVARAAVKQVAIKQISAAATDNNDKRNRQLFEFFLNTANTLLLERADTRTWHTLPGEIYISRIFVPEGDYTAYMKRCQGNREKINTIRVKKGQTRFLLYSSIH